MFKIWKLNDLQMVNFYNNEEHSNKNPGSKFYFSGFLLYNVQLLLFILNDLKIVEDLVELLLNGVGFSIFSNIKEGTLW